MVSSLSKLRAKAPGSPGREPGAQGPGSFLQFRGRDRAATFGRETYGQDPGLGTRNGAWKRSCFHPESVQREALPDVPATRRKRRQERAKNRPEPLPQQFSTVLTAFNPLIATISLRTGSKGLGQNSALFRFAAEETVLRRWLTRRPAKGFLGCVAGSLRVYSRRRLAPFLGDSFPVLPSGIGFQGQAVGGSRARLFYPKGKPTRRGTAGNRNSRMDSDQGPSPEPRRPNANDTGLRSEGHRVG